MGKSVEEKCRKDYESFCDEVDRMAVDGLNLRLLSYAKEQQNVQAMQDESPKLKDLKEQIGEIMGPINDTKKALKLKMRYIRNLIEAKGGQ